MILRDEEIRSDRDGTIRKLVVVGVERHDVKVEGGLDFDQQPALDLSQVEDTKQLEPPPPPALPGNDLFVLNEDVVAQGPKEFSLKPCAEDFAEWVAGFPSLQEHVGIDANDHSN